MCRRCGEPDLRPNAKGRRVLRKWLVDTYGDGRRVQCTWCATWLTVATLELDRLVPGTRYRRDTVVPACPPCNKARTYRDLVVRDGCLYGPVLDYV